MLPVLKRAYGHSQQSRETRLGQPGLLADCSDRRHVHYPARLAELELTDFFKISAPMSLSSLIINLLTNLLTNLLEHISRNRVHDVLRIDGQHPDHALRAAHEVNDPITACRGEWEVRSLLPPLAIGTEPRLSDTFWSLIANRQWTWAERELQQDREHTIHLGSPLRYYGPRQAAEPRTWKSSRIRRSRNLSGSIFPTCGSHLHLCSDSSCISGGNSGDALALFLVLARCLTVRKALALVRGPAAAI